MSYETILVPLDESEFARAALPVAEHLARRDGARLRLVTVHPGIPARPAGRAPEGLVRADRDRREARGEGLRAVAGDLRDRGHEADAELLTGSVVDELVERAEETADLVVMATHGRGPLSRLWLGSIADGVVRTSPVPVLLVRPERGEGNGEGKGEGTRVSAGFRHLLVPLDGSRRAREAIGPALQLLDTGGRLTLARVVVPITTVGFGPADVPSGVDVPATEEMEERARERLEDTASELRSRTGLEVDARVIRDPHPSVAVLEAASEGEMDAIALATHGWSGARRLVLGSVADKVIRGADGPVLVVRPPDRAG